MIIDFRPINKVKKVVKGKQVVLFTPNKVYRGVRNPDGTIITKASKYSEPMELDASDVIIIRYSV
jgi:hypothetical protein